MNKKGDTRDTLLGKNSKPFSFQFMTGKIVHDLEREREMEAEREREREKYSLGCSEFFTELSYFIYGRADSMH